MDPSLDLKALMALDALGEASPEQKVELRRHVASDPALAQDAAAMKQMAESVADTAAAGPAMAVPLPILQRLEETRTQALAKAGRTVEDPVIPGIILEFSARGVANKPATAIPRPADRHRQTSVVRFVAMAATIVFVAGLLAWWLSHPPDSIPALATASPALAPRGVTGMTQPTIVWDNAEEQEYDVWILPEGADQMTAAALFTANKVRSPLAFSTLNPGPANVGKAASLTPGTPYLALVCLAGKGRHAGVTVAFETAPAAVGAPPTLSDVQRAAALARQLLDAGRGSDALMVLAGLPENLRKLPEIISLEDRIRQSLPRLN